MREKKPTKDRAGGFNVSMPNAWIDAIDKECRTTGVDRSTWVRDACEKKFPILSNPEKLGKYLSDNQ